MGGKSSKPDNSAVVNEQKQEAAAEAAKEAARQARIQQGLKSIKEAFHGAPVMASKTTPYDWSSFNSGGGRTVPTGVPEGYSTAYIPGTPTTTATTTTTRGAAAQPSVTYGGPGGQYASSSDSGGASAQYRQKTGNDNAPVATANAASATTMSPGTWGLKDASGKLYKPGDKLDITSQTDTGETTGGFDDAFYNKYKQSVLDYYMPQVDKQYTDAKKQAVYGLGRSGNLVSSAANDLYADLASQNDINTAGVRNQADTAAGDLRNQVNTEEQKAVSQLYATEDPEVAANQSLASVRDISLSQPNMSPLSALFNVATIGGANVLKGYKGQQDLNAFNNQLALPTASRSSSIKSGT